MARRRAAHFVRGAVLAAVVLSSSVAGAKLSPGELPQTRARPLFSSLFQRDMAVLARAIAANDAVEAQRVFFLEKPY
ncbi:MAG TPA: hypothetical protein PLG60_02295, partial [Acidimicrobiales bacterium]|nr:hypothetical protein [Acidimicrobiales bacterium]